MKFRSQALVYILMMSLCGCVPLSLSSGTGQIATVDPPAGSSVLDSSTYAGDALAKVLENRLQAGSMIMVTNLVNINDLRATSTLGRLAPQQIGSRLAQYGYAVVESRLRSSMAMSVNRGEFLLSREAAQLMAAEYGAQAALVGTYAITGGRVFISVRVVSLETQAVLGAYEYYLANGSEARQLAADDDSYLQDGTFEQYVGRRSAFESPSTPDLRGGGIPESRSAAGAPKRVQ